MERIITDLEKLEAEVLARRERFLLPAEQEEFNAIKARDRDRNLGGGGFEDSLELCISDTTRESKLLELIDQRSALAEDKISIQEAKDGKKLGGSAANDVWFGAGSGEG